MNLTYLEQRIVAVLEAHQPLAAGQIMDFLAHDGSKFTPLEDFTKRALMYLATKNVIVKGDLAGRVPTWKLVAS